MARQEFAIGKKLKISKAHQNILLAVLGASVVLGVAMVLSVWLIKYIAFNKKVITAKQEAIVDYSKMIEETGTCEAPKAGAGKVYGADELKECDPNSVNINAVPGTLRYNILAEMAGNTDLESVARTSVSVCYKDGEKMSQEYINEMYRNAKNTEERDYWMSTLKICSALRVVPDALPAAKNPIALLASLDKLFKISGWEPESLSPGKDTSSAGVDIEGLGSIPVSLSLKTNLNTVVKVLNNIETSVREFAISTATVKWNSPTTLEFNANATAYHIEPAKVEEQTKEVRAKEAKGQKK